MKRKELLKTLKAIGCVFVRHGANHDWYRNPQTGKSQPIPRHAEVEESLAKRIIKRLS
ncbi:MAG: type II toxin-antitoxin system HicA family toxin [Thermodesulfobacteriota bacterium]